MGLLFALLKEDDTEAKLHRSIDYLLDQVSYWMCRAIDAEEKLRIQSNGK